MEDIETYMTRSLTERQKHLRLEDQCVFRNIKHRQECRGILAYFLDTTLPDRNIGRVCHGCNVGECCNPHHMYWGTASENAFDLHANNKFLAKSNGELLKKRGHYELLGKMKRVNRGGNRTLKRDDAARRLKDIAESNILELTPEIIGIFSKKWNCTRSAAKKYITKYNVPS